MAESIAVLGLVSAIVQLVDFGSKIIERLNEFTAATDEVPESFRAIKTQLPLFLDTLLRVQAQANTGHINDAAIQALKPVVDSSIDLTNKLTAMLDKVLPMGSVSTVQKRILALKSLGQDKKVLKYVKQLQDNIQPLIFHQTTYHLDVFEQIRQELSQLRLTQQARVPSFGLPSWPEQHSRCLRALYSSDYESHKQSNPSRLPGTCTWFLEHPKYQDWRQEPGSSLLWLSADAGCGKSVLSSFLADELIGATSQVKLPGVVCHFFFKDNENAILALQAILHQCFVKNPSSIEHAMREFSNKGESFANEYASLWRIFINVISHPEADQFVCILDALDECKPSTRGQLLDSLAELFSDNPSSQSCRVKFFVTSRPYASIERRFANLPNIRLKGEAELLGIAHDIDLVVRARVKKISTDRHLSNEQQGHLEETLIGKADKTFIWVSLVLNMIEDSPRTTKKALNEMLSTIPPSLEDTYEKILSHIDHADILPARRVLHIMLAAVEPLDLEQMNAIFSISDEDTSWQNIDLEVSIESYVKHLLPLVVKVVNSRFYFVHHTVKEFLNKPEHEHSSPLLWKRSFSLSESNRILTNSCMRYLILSDFQGKTYRRGLNSPISDAPDWSSVDFEGLNEMEIPNSGEEYQVDETQDLHEGIEEAGILPRRGVDSVSSNAEQEYLSRSLSEDPSIIETEATAFDESRYWMDVLDLAEPRQISTLRYAARYWFVHFSAAQAAGVNQDTALGRCALKLCDSNLPSFRSWYEIWQFPERFKQLECRRTHGLHLAAYLGFSPALALIIEQGLDLNVRDDEGNTALFWAIWAAAKGRPRKSIIKILLDHKINLNAQNHQGNTALHIAILQYAFDGQEDIVRQLLDSHPNLDVFGECHHTLLQCAAIQGRTAIAQLLLKHGSSVDLARPGSETALSIAVAGGHLQIVRMLLKEGADMEKQTYDGLTPLLKGLHSHLYYHQFIDATPLFQECIEELVRSGARIPPKLILDFEDEVKHAMENNTELLHWFFGSGRQSRLPRLKEFFKAKGYPERWFWDDQNWHEQTDNGSLRPQ